MMEFLRPQALEEALSLLAEHPAYTILAGGTDVVVRRREGRLAPEGYLDVTLVPELREIRNGESIFVGAAVTCRELEESPLLAAVCPLLAAAASTVGSPQIRSRATLGGNVANASPAADLIPALTAADAQVVIQGRQGTRRAALPDLIQGPGRCALEPGELILGVVLEPFRETARWSFDKIGRRNALAIARMNGAVVLEEEGGQMRNVRLCAGAAARRPVRFRGAEALLEGQNPDKDLFRRAGEAVSQAILEETGMRESSRYKLPVAVEFTARHLENAARRGQA